MKKLQRYLRKLGSIGIYITRHTPWYALVFLIYAMLQYIYQNRSSDHDKLVDLVIAIVSVLIGVILSATLILWQRSLERKDSEADKLKELETLIPTLFLETKFNIQALEDLRNFLKDNHTSYKATWRRITSITDHFLSDGYKVVRDTKLLDQLGDTKESALISYARLTQVQSLAKAGVAIQEYDAEIRAFNRNEGNQQLETVDSIVAICQQEMDHLKTLLEKQFPNSII